MSFRCPRCGRTSHHPVDAWEGYCGNCHDWTGGDEQQHDDHCRMTCNGMACKIISIQHQMPDQRLVFVFALPESSEIVMIQVMEEPFWMAAYAYQAAVNLEFVYGACPDALRLLSKDTIEAVRRRLPPCDAARPDQAGGQS